MVFSLKRTSPNVTVLRAQPFTIYTNFSRRGATALIYDGPMYSIFNKTNNCTLGVQQPIDGLVNAECLADNHTDPAFQKWQPSLNKTNLVDLRPQARVNFAQVILYCPLNTYTVDETERPCPSYPFMLSPGTSVYAKGIRYHVSYKNVKATEETSSYTFPAVNNSVQAGMRIPDLDELLQNLHDSNLESAELVEKMENHFMIPAKSWLTYFTGALLTAPWWIGPLIILAIYLFKGGSQPLDTNVTVNTLNNTAEEREVFDKVLRQFNKCLK